MKEISEVISEKEDRLQYYSSLHKSMDTAESYYNLAFKISVLDVPKGVDQITPSTARAVIDNATDHVASSWVIVKMEPKAKGKEARKTADKIERVGQAFFYELSMANDSLFIPAMIKSAHEFGMYAVRLIWREDIWEEYEGERFPFRVAVLDPRTVLPEPGNLREPRSVIEWAERQRGDIAALYPQWSKGQEGKSTDMVSFLGRWDGNEYLYAIDEEILVQDKNPYDFIPYSIATNGLGEMTEGTTPDKRVRSLLWAIQDDLDYEARLLSDCGTIVRWGAWGFPTVPEGTNVAVLKDFVMAPGRVNQVPTGFQFQETMKFNPQLLELLGIVRGNIEAATYSGILRGGGAMSSGYERAVAMRSAEQKFAYLLQQINCTLTWLYRSALKIIDTHPDKPSISISGMVKGKRGKASYAQESISQKDIHGEYAGVTCQVEQGDPLANEAKAMLGANLHTGGKISLRSFHEDYAGIEDSTSEQAQMLAERILFSPQIQGMIEQSIIQEVGFAEFVAQEAEGVGETLGVPQEGVTPPGEGAAMFSEAEAMFGPGAPTPEQGRLQQVGAWPARAPGPRFPQMGGG